MYIFASLVNIKHNVFQITSTNSLAPFFMDVFLYSTITFLTNLHNIVKEWELIVGNNFQLNSKLSKHFHHGHPPLIEAYIEVIPQNVQHLAYTYLI
jgi:hypothetical protein